MFSRKLKKIEYFCKMLSMKLLKKVSSKKCSASNHDVPSFHGCISKLELMDFYKNYAIGKHFKCHLKNSKRILKIQKILEVH